MLRPERMSRVSVTGSKSVLDETIETMHDLHLLHLSNYDGSWADFDAGTPLSGAEDSSQKLVTVRALESILDVEDDAFDATYRLDEDELDERLETVRAEVNELDDRRDEIRENLREIRDRIDSMRPFARLGIDLALLDGFDAIEVAVGQGSEQELRAALEDAEEVQSFELFTAEDVLAIAVAPAGDRDPAEALSDALVGVEFTRFEVPDAAETPEAHLEDLRAERERLEADLEAIEDDLAALRDEHGDFLLAAEETLSITVEKKEAPLNFATTQRSFIAEGWLPTDEYVELEAALESRLGRSVAVEELERADHRDGDFRDDHGSHDDVEAPDAVGGEAVATDGGQADLPMARDRPPIEQNNPGPVRPFELLTQAVGRPKYTEIDPTVVLFLTFPLMFGFMIGDVGYGVIYTGIGYWMIRRFDSETFKDFGAVAVAAGLSTVVFGVLYGELFGLHVITEWFWHGMVGLEHAPIEKGLSPATAHWARAWFVITALFGVMHLNLAWIFEFIEEYTFHGIAGAAKETGSWLLALNGLWVFIFSTLFRDSKPDLLFTVFDGGEQAAFHLGFAGLPPVAGWIGLGAVALGLVLMVLGPRHELVEIHQVLAHVLSYLRIGAVLLAKAGMAFAVNLLFFGVYVDHGEYHYMRTHGPEYVLDHYEEATIMFEGMLHGGSVAVAAGILVLLIGHLVVLLLGITSAGIQGVRLEYFEFFSKFYEDGGTTYAPFGYERSYTEE